MVVAAAGEAVLLCFALAAGVLVACCVVELRARECLCRCCACGCGSDWPDVCGEGREKTRRCLTSSSTLRPVSPLKSNSIFHTAKATASDITNSLTKRKHEIKTPVLHVAVENDTR